MNKKIVGVLATVIIIGSTLAGWLVYRNQQTVPNGLINQGYQTVDARQSDNTMVNHLGISVASGDSGGLCFPQLSVSVMMLSCI